MSVRYWTMRPPRWLLMVAALVVFGVALTAGEDDSDVGPKGTNSDAVEAPTDEPQAQRRPQTPTPPFPYTEERVRIEHAEAGLTLAGTLTLPADDVARAPLPAVVLLTPAGPFDRDVTFMGHKIFAVIADHLTRHGFAVLRCDDRGVGESTGDFGTATTADFASDVRAKLRFLRGDERIDHDRIGLIGHSEGGLKAIHAAARDGEHEHRAINYIVLLGSPGVPGDEILMFQQRRASEAEGMDEARIAFNVRLHRRILPLFASDLEDEELREELQKTLDEFNEQANESEREHLESLTDYINQLGSPWFRYFLRYDPRPDLERIAADVPVLAMNGMLDTTVDWEQNLPEIWKALVRGGSDRITLRSLPELNHLFQQSRTGAASEYGLIEQTFSPDALTAITEWLHALP